MRKKGETTEERLALIRARRLKEKQAIKTEILITADLPHDPPYVKAQENEEDEEIEELKEDENGGENEKE